MTSDDYRQLIKDSILDEAAFIKATFSGRQPGQPVPWLKVALRPVQIKDQRHIQFSYFDERQDTTHNYRGVQAVEKLDELLALPFKNFFVATRHNHVQVTMKKGGAVVHIGAAVHRPDAPPLAHDRRKKRVLPDDAPNHFLQAIGVMTPDGKIKAHLQGKFRQINQFLKLISENGELGRLDRSPVSVIDCGCGSATLTFAAYHYLNDVLGVPARLTGIDLKTDLIAQHVELSRALGWTGLTFQTTPIIDYRPETPPDVVLALHACDTATDEALAQAVRWQSRLIFSAPCCHHHLQQQLNGQTSLPSFRPVLRHGILKERLGDVLTDAFRAAILRIMGYQTEVVQFVSSEHTDRNLMIRAVKSAGPEESHLAHEYRQLKDLWQVTPYLEQLLGEAFTDRLR